VHDDGQTQFAPNSQHLAATLAHAVAPSEADLLRCAPGLRVVLLRLTRDPDLAKDLSQDIMISTLKAIRARTIESLDCLPAYLHTAARNAFYSYVRNQPKARDAQAEVSNWAQPVPTPMDVYETQELRQLAQQVLSEMASERDRALIQAFYVQGRTKLELMQTFDLSRDLFDKVLSRARSRMRDILNEKLNEKRATASGITVSDVHPCGGLAS